MYISDIDCDYCHERLSDWDYRYKGKHYCKKCYNYLFHYKICSVCKRKRKVYYALKVPVCKFCQVKGKACIRCEKTNYTFGQITKDGPVCSSCSKYYRQYKPCISCGSTTPTSKRKLLDGTTLLLCAQCYKKNLPICSHCSYRRHPLSYTLNGKPLCKICTLEITRNCKICTKEFPAGKGNICSDCRNTKVLQKKVNFIAISLSDYVSNHFIEFSRWLINRRGLGFTSIHIQNYQKYFFQIDILCNKIERFPTYDELLNHFRFATKRRYYLIHIFLDEQSLIKIDAKTKDKYANFNLIEKQLKAFEKDSYKYKIIHSFYRMLLTKLQKKKTTLRSIRLSLTSAIKFLEYCIHFKDDMPSLYALEGYLWIYPGQRASITTFINFLARDYLYPISVQDVKTVTLQRPKEAHQVLKNRLLNMMRGNNKNSYSKQYYFKTLIGYLHWIDIPENVFVNLEDAKKDKDGNNYIRMGGFEFYLP